MDHLDQAYATGEGVRYWPENELMRFLGTHYPLNTCEYKGDALDIGCGTGRNMWPIAEKGLAVQGIDQSAQAVLCAGKYLRDRLIRSAPCGVGVGRAQDLQWPDQSFDLVVDCQTIQHLSVEDHVKAYAEIARVMRPGGRFWSMHWGYGDAETIYAGKYPELMSRGPVDLRDMIASAGLTYVSQDVVKRIDLDRNTEAAWYCMSWVKP